MTLADDPAIAALCNALAAELQGLSVQVESLATRLMGDEQLVGRWIEQLQSFDLLAQSAQEGANLLSALAAGRTAAQAVDQVRLDRMQQDLRAALRP